MRTDHRGGVEAGSVQWGDPATRMLYPSAQPGPFTFLSCLVRMYGLCGGAQRFARPAPDE